MLLLVNPLAVALEVDLGGWSGLAVQVDRLVLDYVGLLWFHQKHRQWLWGVRREGFWQITEANEVIIDCGMRAKRWSQGGVYEEMKDEGREKLRREAESPRKTEKERERKDDLRQWDCVF